MSSNLADLFAEEPPDGTALVRYVTHDWHAQPEVIWRDDADANQWGAQPTERWFRDCHEDPMTFRAILADAAQVHAVVPLEQSGLKLTGGAQ